MVLTNEELMRAIVKAVDEGRLSIQLRGTDHTDYFTIRVNQAFCTFQSSIVIQCETDAL